ncbi:hypothetical protein BH24ACT15_BH24ACT15_30400 [soil metagenome]
MSVVVGSRWRHRHCPLQVAVVKVDATCITTKPLDGGFGRTQPLSNFLKFYAEVTS